MDKYKIFIGVLITIIILLCIFIPIYIYKIKQNGCGINKNNIGNLLSDYFYNIFTNNSGKCEDRIVTDDNIKKFVDDIKNVNFNNFKSIHKFADDQCDGSKWHSLGRKGFLDFWRDARYKIRYAYDQIIPLEYKNVKYPVIHFRCSDIPFSRNKDYHIPKRSTIVWISEILRKKKYKKAYFLNCTKHLIENDKHQMICEKLRDLYTEIFKENGIDLVLQCNSVMEDFYMMVYSPLLVSLNSSSYSFMAGISKDPNDYISCDMGSEINGKYYKQSIEDSDWITDKNVPVLHADIINYENFDEIRDRIYDN